MRDITSDSNVLSTSDEDMLGALLSASAAEETVPSEDEVMAELLGASAEAEPTEDEVMAELLGASEEPEPTD